MRIVFLYRADDDDDKEDDEATTSKSTSPSATGEVSGNSKSSSAKTLVPAILIPVLAFAVLAAALVFYHKRRKRVLESERRFAPSAFPAHFGPANSASALGRYEMVSQSDFSLSQAQRLAPLRHQDSPGFDHTPITPPAYRKTPQ